GDYVKTYTAANGCDSTVTLHLTINNSVTHQFSVTACDSYTWDGTNYTTSGDYQKTYTAANGCDSTVTLHLTINNSTTHQFSVTACDSYTWDGTNYTTSGDYVKIYTAANDCDSTVTLHLTINNSTTHQFSVTACDSHTWDGTNYTTSGDYVKIFTAANGCDSTITLHLTIFATPIVPICDITPNTVCSGTPDGSIMVTSPIGAEYEYSINNIDYQTDTDFNNLAAGEYNVTVRSVGTTCSNSSTIVVSSTQELPIVTASSNSPLCEGATLQLTGGEAIAGYTYEWAGANNFNNNILSPEINNITLAATGTYTLTVTGTNGCSNSNSTYVIINPTKHHEFSDTSCDEYVWNGIIYNASGDYSQTLQTDNGCDSTVTLHLTMYSTYETTDNLTICESQLPYTWNGFNFTEAGIQTVTLSTVNGCDSVVIINLTVNQSYYNEESGEICDSETYVWGNHNINIGFLTVGTHIIWDSLSTTNGCDSVYKLTLAINSTYAIIDNVTICQSELPYYYAPADTTFQVGTPPLSIIHYPLSTIHGCDSVITLQLTIDTICSELQTQIIPIVKGWSSISSYLAVNDTVTFEGVFENSGMQWVFDPTFGSGIVIIQNPYVNPSISLLVGVNSGTTPWVNKIGYTIYSNEANLSFAIEGLLLEDMQANITAGSWGLIPVLSEYAVNMTDILDDISGLDDSDIIYISSLSTSFMYAAGMVISSSLASLQPGLAYSVYSTKAFTIDYAAYGDKAVTANDSYMPATPWTTAAVNPNYHVIFADAKALHSMSDYIEIGDVVAAFSSTGLCVGQGYYNGEEGLCIKIYGDDAMTEEVDGMTAGEEISFKLYRPTTGETLDIVFEWSSEKAMFGNAAYQTKAFSKIIGVKNITGVEDCNSLNINIYPNPTTGNVYIAANANIKSISVYNSVGALVETMCTSSLQNATTIDLSRYSAGIYMLTITTEEGGSVIKKVVVSQ
ncbi:MAG: T9SS type A sorting domain-containing protein, partial [Bacteroidales bacterium]|nr:T9SS type A sorting domain-containing protein [Bacteroidales bacterium]